MRLVQLKHSQQGRRVALVEGDRLHVLNGFESVYALAQEALRTSRPFTEVITANQSTDSLEYDPIYAGTSEWRLLPAFDHPTDPQHCMLSGTGLTHKASAENRQQMHKAADSGKLTDSMQMYLWGVEGGHPEEGSIGTQPEWFYKGSGAMLRGHNDTLHIPSYGNDGGEEPEVAGIYIVDMDGAPHRIGFATANEFSDHVMERKNYLYLAPSKIRTCAIGPELVVSQDFRSFSGKVAIQRAGEVLWEKAIKSGEQHMAHSLSNLEYHHFKYPNHRLPGQAHVHFFGADAFSFGEQITLEAGDVMEVHWDGLGRALRNSLQVDSGEEVFFAVDPLP